MPASVYSGKGGKVELDGDKIYFEFGGQVICLDGAFATNITIDRVSLGMSPMVEVTLRACNCEMFDSADIPKKVDIKNMSVRDLFDEIKKKLESRNGQS